MDDEQLQYEENLRLLREEVIRANVLVREANQLSSEMKKDTNFTVTLQIPTASLSQAMNKGRLSFFFFVYPNSLRIVCRFFAGKYSSFILM